MKLGHWGVPKLNEFVAMLVEAENEGVTDIRFVRERYQREIEHRLRSGKVQMTEEEKQRARQKKAAHAEARRRGLLERPKPTVQFCPECGSDDWRINFGANPGEWYEGCFYCRYSRPLEVT